MVPRPARWAVLALWVAALGGAAPAQAPAEAPASPSVSAVPAAPVGVSAASAVVMDAATGQILWSRHPDVPRYPASTTKILTAILVRELTDPDETVTVPAEAEQVEGASLHLKAGEWITAGDLLKGILARSANDACHTIALHVSGSVERFAALMNQRAAELGATNTHFTNPHGLHDPAHRTTARDLAILARAALRDPEIDRIVRTRRHTVARSLNLEDTVIISRNRYLDLDPTADGVKTGYTNAAGRCYVGSATRDGMRLITVVLRSENWEVDHRALLDWAFARHAPLEMADPSVPLGDAPVTDGVAGQVPLGVGEPVRGAWPTAGSGPEWRLRRPLQLAAPVRRGDQVGEWVAFREGRPVFAVPAVALADVDALPPVMAAVAGAAGGDRRWNVGMAAMLLAAGASTLARRRTRR